MSEEKQSYEMIDEYLAGELSGKKLEWFQNELKMDAELVQRIELHKKVELLLKESFEKEDFKQRVLAVQKELEEEGFFDQFKDENDSIDLPAESPEVPVINHPAIYKKLWFRAAVSVAATVIICVCTWYFAFHKNLLTGKELFAAHYKAYITTTAVRAENSDAVNLFSRAMQYYDKGEFTQSYKLFDELLAKSAAGPAENFYAGITCIETRNYKRAVSLFNQVIVQNDNIFILQARWYTALCYLGTEDLLSAKSILTKLTSENNVYSSEAAEILSQLK